MHLATTSKIRCCFAVMIGAMWVKNAAAQCGAANACATASDAPGCSDLGCCAAVCSLFNWCCDTAWDGSCVDVAVDLCGLFLWNCIPEPGAPINDCATTPIVADFDVTYAFQTADASTDGPFVDGCAASNDIWFVVCAPDDGELTVDSQTPGFDSIIGIYALGQGMAYDPNLLPEYFMGCTDGQGAGGEKVMLAEVESGTCLLIQIAGVGGASGAGTVRFSFASVIFDTGNTLAVAFDPSAQGNFSLTDLAWSSGNLGTTNPQRWVAQAFTVPEPGEGDNWHLQAIHGYGFTPAGAVNDSLHYVIWTRNGMENPNGESVLASGSVPFPSPADLPGGGSGPEDHTIDLSSAPLALCAGDYWLTLYANSAAAPTPPANFAWLTNAPGGIPNLDPSTGTPRMWRSQTQPAPGFLEFTLPSTVLQQQDGLDPDSVYNTGFRLLGVAAGDDASCPPSSHDCCTIGDPGCAEADCCALACEGDPSCCQSEWDAFCIYEAILACGIECALPESLHDCCTAGVPACSDHQCAETVCGLDPWCCFIEWDEACIGTAMTEEICGCTFVQACGKGGDCLKVGEGPGCADATCCEEICLADGYCCRFAWDLSCAELAEVLCKWVACPGEQDCRETSGEPGCADEECCDAVCNTDAQCCEQAWDAHCAFLADLICTYVLTCREKPVVEFVGDPPRETFAGAASKVCPPKFVGKNFVWGGFAGQMVGLLEPNTKITIKMTSPPDVSLLPKCFLQAKVGFIQNVLSVSAIAEYSGAEPSTMVRKDGLPTIQLCDSNDPPFLDGHKTGLVEGQQFVLRASDQPGSEVPTTKKGKGNVPAPLKHVKYEVEYITWLVIKTPERTLPCPMWFWRWTVTHEYFFKIVKNKPVLDTSKPNVATAKVNQSGAGHGGMVPVIAPKAQCANNMFEWKH